LRHSGIWSVLTVFSIFLTGCGTTEVQPNSEEESASTSSSLVESSKESSLSTLSIGETVALNEAELTVESVEEVESYPTECSDNYTATEGRSLHVIDIVVTNTSKDIQYPDGQFIGSELVTFRDNEEREMQFVFPGCKLKGEETFDGLMSGETSSRPLLIEGASSDSQPGWMELASSFDAVEPTIILLDEDIEITRVAE